MWLMASVRYILILFIDLLKSEFHEPPHEPPMPTYEHLQPINVPTPSKLAITYTK